MPLAAAPEAEEHPEAGEVAAQREGPSEMDRLRFAAEAALAPFIARVQAMGEPAAVEEVRVPPPRPAPPPVEEPRPTDVATPIVVAREPGVMPWDTVLEPHARSELRDPEAPRVPTLKSVAAASRASASALTPVTPVTPVAATPRQARASEAATSRPRRWPWIVGVIILLLALSAGAAAVMLR